MAACACGYVASFSVGFVTIVGVDYVSVVGATCSSGKELADPAADELAPSLTSSETTVAVSVCYTS